jgi:hypothetical protein
MENTLRIPKRRLRDRFFARVGEMIGVVDAQPTVWNKVTAMWDNLFKPPTVNWKRTNYDLARALYYGSVMESKKDGHHYGKEYLFAAGLCKPIINALVSFALPDAIRIKDKKKEEGSKSYTETNVNQWLAGKEREISDAFRHSFRDGDTYPVVENDLSIIELDANYVDKIVDELDNCKTIGFDQTITILEEDKNVVYRTEYRPEGKTVWQITGKQEKEMTDQSEEYAEGEPMPIVHFYNEKEPSQIYGYSEYQNLYHLLINYSKVIESGVGVILYDSDPILYVQNVQDVDAFIKANGSKSETKKDHYKIKLDTDSKLLVGPEGTQFGMLRMADNMAGTSAILNLLFWNILQAAETPEFVFGGAVQSSKASVSEQVPVMVKKAQRKQKQYKEMLIQLIRVYLYKAQKSDPKIDVEMEFDLMMPEIVDKNLDLNVKIVDLLLKNSLIRGETALELLNVDRAVTDVGKEVETAKGQEGQAIINAAKSLSTQEKQGQAIANPSVSPTQPTTPIVPPTK